MIPKLQGLGSLLSGVADMPFLVLEDTGFSLEDSELLKDRDVRETLPNMLAEVHARGVAWKDVAGWNVTRDAHGGLRLIDFGQAMKTQDPRVFDAEKAQLASLFK